MEEYERETPFERRNVPAGGGAHQDEAARRTGGGIRRWRQGQKVKKGQVVGRVEDGKLGAHVHASIDGKVRAVTADFVEIVA